MREGLLKLVAPLFWFTAGILTGLGLQFYFLRLFIGLKAFRDYALHFKRSAAVF